MLGPAGRPQEIGLPGPPLGELGPLPAPLRFGTAEAQLVFGPRALDQAPRLASPLPFKRYDALARRFARQLGESVGVGERVRRLLWEDQILLAARCRRVRAMHVNHRRRPTGDHRDRRQNHFEDVPVAWGAAGRTAS